MQLKEVQMLGVLALIAVGIILLSTWGEPEEERAEAPAAETEAVATVSSPPEVTELEELVKLLEETDAAAQQATDQGSVVATESSGAESPDPVAQEDAVYSEVIEGHEPSEIPVVQSGDAEMVVPKKVWHTVKKGETLSHISRSYYGTTSKWREIFEANKQRFSDPRRLRVGMRLLIPSADGKAVAEAPRLATEGKSDEVRTYLVEKGDTLYFIAREVYGDGGRWRELKDANADKVGKDNNIRVGSTLVVP